MIGTQRIEGHNYSFSFAFKQQLMRAWQPVPTLCSAIILFFVFGIVFLGIGIFMFVISNGLYDEKWRYDDKCKD